MKYILPYVLIVLVFFGFLFSIVYFTTSYTIDDFMHEAFSITIFIISIGIVLLFFLFLYKFCYKTMFKIFSRFGGIYVDEYCVDEKKVKQSFGVFTFNCFLISFGIFVTLIVIGFLIFWWYYSIGIISLIFLLIFEKDTKWKNHIKGLVIGLLIIFLITMYQYRNCL